MMDFNTHYIVSSHVFDRYRDRIKKEVTKEEMKRHVLEMVKSGLEIFKQNDHKFIRFQDYIFPCVRIEGTENTYKIKTILTWDIAENLIYYIEQLN